MWRFNKKVEELKEACANVAYASRAHMRLGSIRNLTFIPQFDIMPNNIDSKKPILLFGAGKFGKAAADFLLSSNVTITAFVDNKLAGQDMQIQHVSIPIISFSKMVSDFPDAYISIAVADTNYYNEISSLLENMNIECCDVVGYFIIDGLRKAYTLFEDDLSKLEILDYMKYLVSYSRYYENYFDGCIKSLLTENEVFVDVGVWNCDTIFEFIKHTDGKYKHIYGFEANKDVYQKYMIKLKDIKNVTYENKGVMAVDCQLELAEGEESSSSFYTEYYDKTYLVDCVSLDSYFNEKPDDELPTFIKADVEGAELDVLMGLRKIAARKRPKLAICVYHKTEHFWRVPELIKEIDPTYKLYMRHYSPDDAREYVLFAV